MNLLELEKALQANEFDTSIDDNVLVANRGNAEENIEIVIDSAGGCLVKKTVQENRPSKSILIEKQKISKISFVTKTSQIRIKLSVISNLLDVLKVVSTPRF